MTEAVFALVVAGAVVAATGAAVGAGAGAGALVSLAESALGFEPSETFVAGLGLDFPAP